MPRKPADFRHLEIPQHVIFEEGSGGLVRIAVNTPLASAHVYLHGAHIAHYQPASILQPVLFMSGASQFSTGKPIRGGVPICFPWFGPRAGHPESPAHGFARTTEWEAESITHDGGIVTLTLRLSSTEETRKLWPHDFILRHRITIGATLEMTLETQNPSSTAWDIEEALHAYFAVGDVRNVSITGLSGAGFVDKVDSGARKTQDSAPIRITAETDRVYPSSQAACVIEDPDLQRRITIKKCGSNTTVLWNPWIAKSKAMADFGDDEWPGMLCVETANSGENAITLLPGQTHSMTASISVTQ